MRRTHSDTVDAIRSEVRPPAGRTRRKPVVFARAALVAACMVCALVITPASRAHKNVCAHTHDDTFPKDLIYCDSPGDICEDEKVCTAVQNTRRGWCDCLEEKASVALSGVGVLSSGNPASPGAFETVTYTAVSAPENVWDVIELPSYASVLELGPGGLDATGTLLLEFGSFSDPLSVPVTLHDVSLSLPAFLFAGQDTGPNLVRLPAGYTHPLVYDSITGVVEPADPFGIPMVLENDLGVWTDAKLFIELTVGPGGGEVFLQGLAYLPPPVPGMGPGGQALLVALMMLALAAPAVVARARADAVSGR